MKYVAALAEGRAAVQIEAETFAEALLAIGLSPGYIDHGTPRRGIGIALYEFGMFVAPKRQTYFSIDRTLYAGSALLYGVDEQGETVDLDLDLRIFRWFSGVAEIERAISNKEIGRPIFAAGDKVLWRWPEPRPDLDHAIEQLADALASSRRLVIDGDTIITKL